MGYARDVLGARLWARQEESLEALLAPPYRVLDLASHGVGKTFLAAVAVNWWFDTRDPSGCITTAPNLRQVKDLLWREVRLQRRGRRVRDSFAGPQAPLLWTAPDHYAKGVTSATGEGFQGRHDHALLFVLDEAIGVPGFVWETIRTMFAPTGAHAVLAIGNPTDTTSTAYQEAMSGGWRVIQMSALDHPNLAAELAGDEPPFPAAVRLAQVDEQLRDWCEPVTGDVLATDVEWPPHSGRYLRPGPIAEARVLGRWPSAGTYGVWSDSLWHAAASAAPEVPGGAVPELGCDVARYGDDATAIHAQAGGVSLLHEEHNGWLVPQVAGRLKELCRQLSAEFGTALPEHIPVKVDDDGVGGGVVDLKGGYRFVGVNAGSRPHRPSDYPNKRSELWFFTVERARRGLVALGRLPRTVLDRLRQQAMNPAWKLDAAGRRVVEPKAETKRKLGRSPDGLDAMNLAHYPAGHDLVGAAVPPDTAPRQPRRTPGSPLPGRKDRGGRSAGARRLLGG